MLAAPIGHTRVAPTMRALSTMKRVMDALSFAGSLFAARRSARTMCRRSARRPPFPLAGRQKIENPHAHRHSVGNLFQNAGLWAVSDFRSNFDPAIHRAGMQNQSVGLGKLQALGVQLVSVNVIVRGNEGLVLP